VSAFVIEFISHECVAEFGSSVLLCCIFISLFPPSPSSGVSKLCHLKVMHILNLFDLNSEFLVRYGIESLQNNLMFVYIGALQFPLVNMRDGTAFDF